MPPPLSQATVQGKVSVVEALLEYKARLNLEQTYCDETAFYVAVKKG